MPLAVPSFTLGAPSSTISTPFFIVPVSTDVQGKHVDPNPHYYQPTAHTTALNQSVAHKHAHHLHSIPPRQKSTKSLILDHLVWLHAVARVAQGKAQAGSLPDSDSVCDNLRYGANADKNRKSIAVADTDLVQARALKARAEGLEKVLAAMIVQPAPVKSTKSVSGSSPFANANVAVSEGESSAHYDQKAQQDGNALPNGVRVRVAIAALINDLIAYSQPSVSSSTASSSSATSSSSSPHIPLNPASPATTAGNVSELNRTKPSSCIPEGLLPLSRASYSDHVSYRLPSLAMLTNSPKLSASHPSASKAQPNSGIFNAQTWVQPLGTIGSSHGDQASNQLPPASTSSRTVNARSRDLFSIGIEPQSTRCERHLRTDCASCVAVVAAPSTSPIGSGLPRSTDGRPFRRPKDAQYAKSQQPRTLELLSHFLRLSAMLCAELSKEAIERRDSGEGNQDDVLMSLDPTASTSSFTSSSCSSTSETPRESSTGPSPKSKKFNIPFLAKSPNSSETSLSEDSEDADLAVRPTREWYALLAGLLTRTVLEGYLLKGWKGTHVAEAVFGIGLVEGGVKEKKAKKRKSLFSRKTDEEPSVPQSQPEPEDLPDFLIPDDLPSLSDAAATLFTRATTTTSVKEMDSDPVREYTAEMEKRLSEFLNVPSHYANLESHLDALALQYTAEPVESAAVRFCEAVCEWRGKPELEAYKSIREPPAQTRDGARPSPYLHPGPSGHSGLSGLSAHSAGHSYGGHSRSPSVQSVSSMIHQTPGKQRHQSLTSNTSLVHSVDTHNALNAAGSPLTSMSIASLVHHPVSPPSFTESLASESVVSVNVFASQRTPKRPIDHFFAAPLPVPIDDGSVPLHPQSQVVSGTDDTQMQVESTLGVMMGPKAKNPIDIWTRFTLGSKRPREPSSDSRADGERPGKKALFVTSGIFN